MNPRFWLQFLVCRRDKGFVMPLVIMIGLVIMVVGAVLLQKGQQDQVSSVNQKLTAEGLSMAEAGLTRIQNLIVRNPNIATYSDCTTARSSGACSDTGTALSWANPDGIELYAPIGISQSECYARTGNTPNGLEVNLIKQLALNNSSWLPIGNKGSYRLISYQYQPASGTPGELPGTATLTLEGQVNQSQAINNAVSRLEVSIPVEINSAGIPGLWLASGDTSGSNNTIEGNVFLNQCSANASTINVTSGFKALYTVVPMPNVQQPEPSKYTQSNSPEEIQLSDKATDLDQLLANFKALSPTARKAIYAQVYPGQSLDIMPLPYPGVTDVYKLDGQGRKVYQYRVNNIKNQTAASPIQVQSGKIVEIYLDGEIDGNVELIHDCAGYVPPNPNPNNESCKPTNFRIFGYNKYRADTSQPPGTPLPLICLQGNNRLQAFVLAPSYQGGVKGAGDGGGIDGSMWVWSWASSGQCGSGTINTTVTQTAEWEELLGSDLTPPPQISTISSWSKRQAN